MAYLFPFDLTIIGLTLVVLNFLLVHINVEYGTPVDTEAFEIESYTIGSPSFKATVTCELLTIGLNPNIAFNSFNL